tara:strand:+ start:1123 stop:1707 length:585 start_codon:yes stop_codon:yes gene_type:complete
MSTQQKKTFNTQRKQGFKLAVGQLGLFDNPDQPESEPKKSKTAKPTTRRKRFDVRNRIRNLEKLNHMVVEDDLLLIFLMWKEDGLEKVLSTRDPGAWVIWFMSRATSPESIRRSRQSLTSTDKGPPEIWVSEEITETRKKRAEEWREYWGDPDSTIELSEAQRFLEKEIEFMRRRAGIVIHGFPPFTESEKHVL